MASSANTSSALVSDASSSATDVAWLRGPYRIGTRLENFRRWRDADGGRHDGAPEDAQDSQLGENALDTRLHDRRPRIAGSADRFGIAGVDKHDPGNLLGIGGAETKRKEAADRMADKEVWAGLAAGVQKRVELICPVSGGPGRRSFIAPRHARAIVAADTRASSQVALNPGPTKRRLAEARLEDDRRLPFAAAQQVQAVATDIEHAARWRIALSVARSGSALVCESEYRDRKQQEGDNERSVGDAF